MLAAELKTLPNELQIEGHTDATPYSSGANYSNWELSADRANAARRLLQQNGVRSNQVTQIRGYADQFLRVKDNPYDPSNRRVTLLVKNGNNDAPIRAPTHAQVAGGAAAAPPTHAAPATSTTPKVAAAPQAIPPGKKR